MNYIELTLRFWDFNQKNAIGSTGISMYLYLLKVGHENNSCSFQISDVVVSKVLGLTRKTVKFTKEKLKDFGLIQFQTKSGIPCNYRLIEDYPLQISEPKIIKKKKLKTEEFIRKIENSTIPVPSVSSTQNIPSLEEFLEYVKTLETYEPYLDSEIQEKYEDWKKNGWKNSTNRPITNWKSSLKSSLPFMINQMETHQISLESIPNIKRPKSQNDN